MNFSDKGFAPLGGVRIYFSDSLCTFREVIDGVDWLPGPGYNNRKDWIVVVRKHNEAIPSKEIIHDTLRDVFYAHTSMRATIEDALKKAQR